MTGRQFTRALTRLGLTQTGFAAVIEVNERTVRYWVSGRSVVPTAIAMLLNLMLDTHKNVQDLRQ